MLPRPLAALLVLVAFLGAPAAAAASAGSAVGAADASLSLPDAAPAQPALARNVTEPAGLTMVIQVRADGAARWTVSARFHLATENDTDAFARLAEEFTAGQGAGLSLSTFREASAAASEATGREMTVRDVNRTAVVENDTGRLILRFTWTNFASETGSHIRIGDAFNTTSGTWLPGLAEGQVLVVRSPPGYGIESAPIGPVNGTLRWEGPRDFEPGYLSVSFRGQLPPGTPSTTSPPPADPTRSLLPLVGVVVGLGALALGGYALSRRRGGVPAAATTVGGGGTTAAEADAATADEATGGIDEDLLSDEERVERLLERNGGRMRQADIVKETGWSNAKVSQLLSGMNEAGRIDKLRIGRENLISLPGRGVGEPESDSPAERQ